MKLLILLCSILSVLRAEETSTALMTSPKNYKILNESSSQVTFTSWNSENPDLNCIMFGDLVCSISCGVLSKLYTGKEERVGKCDQSQLCICQQSRENNLDALWKSKFLETRQSTAILRRIKRNAKLYSEVMSILEQPLLSVKEMKLMLANPLKKMSDRLEIKEQIINNYIDEDGIISADKMTELDDWVVDNTSISLSSDEQKNLIDNDYRIRLTNFLTTQDNAVIKNVLMRVDYLYSNVGNDLADYIYNNLKKNGKLEDNALQIKESEIDEPTSLSVANLVGNKMTEAFTSYLVAKNQPFNSNRYA